MDCLNRLKSILSFLIIIFPFLTHPLGAQGSSYKTGDVYRLAAEDTVTGQLFAAGEWVEIEGHAGNDLYAAGSTITIEGSIGDDAFLTGNTTILKGVVSDMLVSVSESLLIGGSVEGDLFAAGEQIRLSENALIGGNLFLAGKEISVDGAVITGRTRIAGKTIRLNGVFGDHVVIYSNDVTFGPDYSPAGDTKILSSSELYRENMGNLPERLTIETRQPPAMPVFLFQVWLYLSMMVTGSVLIYLFKPVATDLHRFATERFWKNTGIGFLLILLVPFLLFLLLFPVITIPLAILICALFTISLYLSYLAVSMMLGLQFIQWFKKEITGSTYYWSLALGLILIAVINNLPFIGPLFSLLLLFFGTGSFWAYMVKRYAEPVRSNV